MYTCVPSMKLGSSLRVLVHVVISMETVDPLFDYTLTRTSWSRLPQYRGVFRPSKLLHDCKFQGEKPCCIDFVNHLCGSLLDLQLLYHS